MTPVGIIIVTYNSGAEIGACLDAALSTGSDIMVVDNASQDDTVLQVRRKTVRLIANAENRGFAAAVNQGCTLLENRYLLLLNPDAILLSGLDKLCAASDIPQSAGAGGQLVDEQWHPQAGFMARQLPTPAALILEAILLNRIWPGNPINREYRLLGRDYTVSFPVEQPAGAFFLFRREVWAKLGGLDEGFYPLWFEDVDFCKRIQELGLKLHYVPGAVAKHTGGHSIAGLGVEIRRFYWYRSLLRYSSKHFRRGAHAAVCAAVILGSIIRGIAESVMDRSIRPLKSYRDVMRLAGQSLVSGSRP